jgi:hypothetical protein
MTPYERQIKLNERGILETKIKGYEGLIAQLHENKAIWNSDLWAKEKAHYEGIIEATNRGIAELDSQLAGK